MSAGPDLYRNRDFIPDFDAIMAETAARSHEVMAGAAGMRDHPYGPSPRERMDILLPPGLKPGASMHLFIHGGYWRSGSKEAHHLVAAPVLAAGGIAAIATYNLMPDTRLAKIIAEVRAAARHFQAMAAIWGADPTRFTVSGHSAGAHLASYLAAHGPLDPPDLLLPDLAGMLLVSGLYDLSEIPFSFLKDEARMTPEEAAAWSPVTSRALNTGPRIITRGEGETLPFHQQAEAYARGLTDQGHEVSLRQEPGLNHLTIVLSLGDINSRLGTLLADLVAG